MGSKHGHRVTIPSLPSTLDLPNRSLKSRKELLKFLEETMNGVRQGSFDATIMEVLAGIASEALDQRSARTSAEAKARLNTLVCTRRSYLPGDGIKDIQTIQKEEREKRRTLLGPPPSALPSDPEPTAQIASERGRKGTCSSPPTAHDLPYKPLTNGADLIEFLEEAINRVRQGPFDLGAAKTIAGLARRLLKEVDQHPSTAAPVQLYAKRLYLPDWRRERIEKIQQEERERYNRSLDAEEAEINSASDDLKQAGANLSSKN